MSARLSFRPRMKYALDSRNRGTLGFVVRAENARMTQVTGLPRSYETPNPLGSP